MVERMSEDTNVSKNSDGKLSNEVTSVMDEIIKDYYEAESWQFSGCGD